MALRFPLDFDFPVRNMVGGEACACILPSAPAVPFSCPQSPGTNSVLSIYIVVIIKVLVTAEPSSKMLSLLSLSSSCFSVHGFNSVLN